MWNLKNNTNKSTGKTEILTDTENNLMVIKVEREEQRDKLGVWD